MKKLNFYVIIIVLLMGIAMYRPINKVSNRRDVVTTVTNKDIKNNYKTSKYLIFCKNNKGNTEVFEITDSFFASRFNSSDIYANIEIGKTYTFNVGGSRNNLFSWYPNIYTYQEINE